MNVGNGNVSDVSGTNQREDVSDATGNVGNIDHENQEQTTPEFRKLLGQRKKDKARLIEMEQKLHHYEAERREAEEKKLQEEGEFKTLLQRKEEELAAERERAKKAEDSLNYSYKLRAVLEKLPGKIRRNEYIDFMNVDAVKFDAESMDIDENSVQEVVNGFVTKYNDLIDYGDHGVMPGQAPGAPKKTSYEDELKGARTQKELDAILKKYGRK
jgi:hypothetical protein